MRTISKRKGRGGGGGCSTALVVSILTPSQSFLSPIYSVYSSKRLSSPGGDPDEFCALSEDQSCPSYDCNGQQKLHNSCKSSLHLAATSPAQATARSGGETNAGWAAGFLHRPLVRHFRGHCPGVQKAPCTTRHCRLRQTTYASRRRVKDKDCWGRRALSSWRPEGGIDAGADRSETRDATASPDSRSKIRQRRIYNRCASTKSLRCLSMAKHADEKSSSYRPRY